MVTQTMIAERIGLDVSSVNKILNRAPGPVFKKETIRLVFKVAREMKYHFRNDSKQLLKRRIEDLEKALRELVPSILTADQMVALYHVPADRAQQIKELAYGKRSA